MFVEPSPDTLELFGDKGRARALATQCGVPILPGPDGPTLLDDARAFLASLGPGGAVMVRPLRAAFGDGALYVEQFLPCAPHVEVQMVGDGAKVSHLWDRECSLQRQRQEVVEIALGMVGRAMVEGGGLGVVRPEEIGPVKVTRTNGPIDVLVEDEAAAVAKQYLFYFQGSLQDWVCADPREVRRAIPENRLRATTSAD